MLTFMTCAAILLFALSIFLGLSLWEASTDRDWNRNEALRQEMKLGDANRHIRDLKDDLHAKNLELQRANDKLDEVRRVFSGEWAEHVER